jgi:hypothetical protein
VVIFHGIALGEQVLGSALLMCVRPDELSLAVVILIPVTNS